MTDEQMQLRRFSKDDAIVIRRIMMLGATEHGEHVGLEIETDSNQNCVLLVPFGLFQKLLLGLMTAGGVARREQLARHGSDSNVLSVAGFSAFHPTGYDVTRGMLANGKDVVLLRLKKGDLPIIDVTAAVGDAKRMAHDILTEVAKKPGVRRPSH
ncbi:MAG TPA: hypothetical protein VJ728_18025 [Candidatus Binataceae bacterium]|nr:hypothetical protein [Candidatus Binataceae bacterium]